MELDRYQHDAQETDRVPGSVDDKDRETIIVPMLGLAGEAGQLLSEYKKHLRDGDAHTLFKDRVSEELGDLLWYIANVASKFDLSLNDIAAANLKKTKERWLEKKNEAVFFDESYPPEQQLPRQAAIEIHALDEEKVRIFVNGKKAGAELTDNAYDPDGYRFHDVFHFTYAAVLGWSPVTRAIIDCKRRADKKTDEVEDGGRATVIEEGISALVFEYARCHNFLDGISRLDYGLLRTIQDMTAYLEVKDRTPAEWEDAILQGFAVWKKVVENNGGALKLDMHKKSIEFIGPVGDLPAETA